MLKFSANLSMLFTEVDFIQRFEEAHKAGFTGVEYLFPYDYPAELVKEQLSKYDLEQVLFNLPAGNWDGGERGIACLPDRVDEFRSGVEKAIEYAKVLECKMVNCLVGIKPAAVSDEDAYKTLVENLKFAAEKLVKQGITLVFEPINNIDIPSYFVNCTQQAVQIMQDVSHQNLLLQYDIYHMQISEGDIIRTMNNTMSSIAHVQLADNPGRHEPGTGEINYQNVLSNLSASNYSGWVGCEYKPINSTSEGLDWITIYR